VMTQAIPEALLWLLVLNLGIAFGAGLYETRIVLPLWFVRSGTGGLHVNGEAIRETNTGLRFWAFVTTGPLTLITLANLALAWRSPGARHEWWLAAVAVTLVERTGTFAFFIPTAMKLMRAETMLASTAAKMGLAGWLAALRALTLPG